jgi:hypothetical protein
MKRQMEAFFSKADRRAEEIAEGKMRKYQRNTQSTSNGERLRDEEEESKTVKNEQD